ncbi:MAG: LamG domain-containing protein [Candidatus Omnitrophica bacterium]|nr:LamG domain-containing protein [Candidatus Omnitrophota bacterium]
MTSKKFLKRGVWIAILVALSMPAIAQEVYMWEFNEGDGSTVTDTTGQYSATLGASAGVPDIVEDSPTGAAGDFSVRPTNGYSVDDSVDPIFSALQEGPVTVEAWVKPDALSGNTDIVRIGNSIKAGFANSSPLFTFLGIVDIPSTLAVPVDGSWHHVAYVWEPGVGVTFYVDNDAEDFVEETRAPRDYENNLMSIGSGHDGGSSFTGLVDRVRVHQGQLSQSELDMDAANANEITETTLAAYNFDEGEEPFESSAGVSRPAVSMGQILYENSIPTFSPDSPTGEAGDYSMSFDGDDRVVYDDNETYFFDVIDEPFTFEVWMKFRQEEQIASRPVFFAYGQGGVGGYSFSFRPASPSQQITGASGQDGDKAIRPNGGLVIDDSADSVLGDLKEGPITFEAWIIPEELNDYQDLFRIGNSIKAGFAESNPVFTFLGVVDIIPEFTVSASDAWHHIAYVWEPGSGVSFYFDGVKEGFVEATGAPNDYTNAEMSIGASHDGSSSFQGVIDRFRIHKAALTADQLDADAANPKDALSSTVVAYNFDEDGAPFQNAADADKPVIDKKENNYLTVTTFGIVDAHSNAQIPNDGQWHHVASVFDWDGYQFLFYVDGELADSYDYEDGVKFVPENEAFLYFGCERGGGLPYVGLLDRIKITRGALTPDELDYFEPVSVDAWCLY